MEFSLIDALIIIGSGLFGGFINCILFDQGLRFPSRDVDADNKPIYTLGSFGPIILGVAASLLAWGFGVGQMNNFKNELALLVLSGIGGGSFITNLMQKQQIGVEKGKSTALVDVAKKTVKQLHEATQKASRGIVRM